MKIDMSRNSITTRLKRVSQLRNLCLSLNKAIKTKNKTSESLKRPEDNKLLSKEI